MLEEIILNGCTPEPLGNYLKALGVLRLVVEQKDSNAKCLWRNDEFVLKTKLTRNQLTKFFLNEYKPTPLIAPWNGSTGFYLKDNRKTLEAVISAKTGRFADYRETIKTAQTQVKSLQLIEQPKDKDVKRLLLTRLRNNLPDEAVKWLDTCALITDENLGFPPLTGTGGNDGNFEFSRTFMQQLQELIDFETGEPSANSANLLEAAIFGETIPGLPFSGKIGQFNPLAAGGANAAPGYEGDSRVNPWDYVLMLEGTLLFTSAATRRYERVGGGKLAYPFTVDCSKIGYGSAAEEDEARAELWIPLWENPTGLKELQTLFGEGRAKVGGRAAKTGVDFAMAVSTLGVNRGISEFVRYSFQVRNGLSYFAIPLGRFQPKLNPQMELVSELDNWLLDLRKAVNGDKAPASVKSAYRKLENAIVDLAKQRSFSRSHSKSKLLDVLIALGEMEKALDRSLKFTTDDKNKIKPVPLLKAEWVKECNDGSIEFRLALSLARKGLYQKVITNKDSKEDFLVDYPFTGRGFRQRLVQVRGDYLPYWKNEENRINSLRSGGRKEKEENGITTWQSGSLVKNLIAMLRREKIEAERQEKQEAEMPKEEIEKKPTSRPVASLGDIACWIEGETNDDKIEAIARGLSLVSFHKPVDFEEVHIKPPDAYALLAIAHRRLVKIHDKHWELAKQLTLPRVSGMLSRLAAGDCFKATELAARRLHASGLKPWLQDGIYESRDKTLRIAAALAFPISDRDAEILLRQVCQIEDLLEDL